MAEFAEQDIVDNAHVTRLKAVAHGLFHLGDIRIIEQVFQLCDGGNAIGGKYLLEPAIRFGFGARKAVPDQHGKHAREGLRR